MTPASGTALHEALHPAASARARQRYATTSTAHITLLWCACCMCIAAGTPRSTNRFIVQVQEALLAAFPIVMQSLHADTGRTEAVILAQSKVQRGMLQAASGLLKLQQQLLGRLDVSHTQLWSAAARLVHGKYGSATADEFLAAVSCLVMLLEDDQQACASCSVRRPRVLLISPQQKRLACCHESIMAPQAKLAPDWSHPQPHIRHSSIGPYLRAGSSKKQ